MALPSHLFVSSSDGCLYDTRAPDWSKRAPLRQHYCGHFRRDITRSAEVRAALRSGASTDVGGYPLYFVTSDGGALAFETVRRNLRSVLEAVAEARRGDPWRVVSVEVNYEDNDLTDDHTGERIPCAYGDA